jgi:hypothetical protein
MACALHSTLSAFQANGERTMHTRVRAEQFLFAVLAAVAIIGCGSNPTQDSAVDATEQVCPPDDPECDRLDQPCVEDDDELGTSSNGPGSSPMGLTDDKTASGKYRAWPKGRVPYKIDASVGSVTKGLLLDAMKEWQTKSEQRVRFEKATADDGTYLIVYGDASPITNQVGYHGGTISKMKLRNPEYITVIRHELGHVLGLHHEQRRADRNDYIQVKTANVVDTTLCKNQFNVCTDCVPIKNYNVKSVMHYRTSDLSNCRTGKVLLNKDGSDIQHYWAISNGDLLAIAELYGSAPISGTSDAGVADATIDTGSAGAGGAAGTSSGLAGATGDGGIDTPDETSGGGTSGSAGNPWAAGGSLTGAGTSSGGTKGAADASSADESGGCSLGTARRAGSDSILLALAIASLGWLRRRRQIAELR